MHEFSIQNEGHTVGCLLRERLLETSRFAACIVKHPQDENLIIKIDGDHPRQLILDAVASASETLDDLEKLINRHVSPHPRDNSIRCRSESEIR